MGDSGVDTSNENSDNSIHLFSDCSLEQSQPIFKIIAPLNPDDDPQCMFNIPAIPINEHGQAMPVHFFGEPSTHNHINKLKCSSKTRNYRQQYRTSTGLLVARNLKLNLAVYSNNVKRAEMLIEKGADPNYSDAQKRTPLHLAACRGYVDMVKLLLKKGANPNSKDILGNTPLHLASCTSNCAVVNELLDAGTEINANDKNGRNPLQLARSKLRVIQAISLASNTQETKGLIDEMCLIVTMMDKYRKKQNAEAKELESVMERLEKMTTREEVDSEVQNLLENLKVL